MFVDVLCSLSVQDELSLVGNPNYVVLHGVAEQPLRLQKKLNAEDSIINQSIYVIIQNMLSKEGAVLRQTQLVRIVQHRTCFKSRVANSFICLRYVARLQVSDRLLCGIKEGMECH